MSEKIRAKILEINEPEDGEEHVVITLRTLADVWEEGGLIEGDWVEVVDAARGEG